MPILIKKFLSVFGLIFLILMLFDLGMALHRHKERIDAVEASQRQTNERLRDLTMFTVQTVDDNTETNDEFRKHMYQNFKFLNHKIDKVLCALKQIPESHKV
jgi:uncharacterized membrane protein